MLVLSRWPGQQIQIGDNIRIVLIDVRGETVRIGVEAPKKIPVWRSEIANVAKHGCQRKTE